MKQLLTQPGKNTNSLAGFGRIAAAALLLGGVATAAAESRVQDIAHLQGERTNRLMGYGLVVGLKGTGDGDKNLPTMQKLMALHQRYATPVLDLEQLKGNNTVALVAVEASIPEFGAREGDVLDVTISAVGTAKSLEGGQLLTTPLQYAMFSDADPGSQQILALAGGRIDLPRKDMPTRGQIVRGATLEQDFFYNFIADGAITLVLDDAHTGWPWAQMVARNVNHELSGPGADRSNREDGGRRLVQGDAAVAVGPREVRVRIPSYELAQPAGYIARVLQAPLFLVPHEAARVAINASTNEISLIGEVGVAPTILQIPGYGTLLIGDPAEPAQPAEPGQPAPAVPPGAEKAADTVDLHALLSTFTKLKIPPQVQVDAIRHLHKTGSLRATLQFTE